MIVLWHKRKVIFTIALMNTTFFYDAKIMDKYSQVAGYIVNKYVRRGKYIELDRTINDKYGRTK